MAYEVAERPYDFLPSLCKDNLFVDPHKIINYANTLDFKQTATNSEIKVLEQYLSINSTFNAYSKFDYY